MRFVPLALVFLGGLFLIVVGVLAFISLAAQQRLTERFDNPVREISVAGTPEQVERGAYLVTAMPGCAGCHASDPSAQPPVLDGRKVEDIAVLATLYAPNLTPGALAEWSDGEIVRAIREGVTRDGRGLLLMPSGSYRHLSDEDVQAIVAFLRSQPAVENELPLPSLRPLGRLLMGTAQFGTNRQAPVRSVTAPPRRPNAAYGKYLSDVSGCGTCHGAALDGQDVRPGPPPGPSLRVVKGWTPEQFIRTMREGVDPSGRRISDEMPWRQFGRATDDDLRAVYEHLRSLP